MNYAKPTFGATLSLPRANHRGVPGGASPPPAVSRSRDRRRALH